MVRCCGLVDALSARLWRPSVSNLQPQLPSARIAEMDDADRLREFFKDVDAAPQFSARPIDIPGDLRIAWRLSVLCLLLRRGRANLLALEHLHVLWWAVRSEATRTLLLRWMTGEGRPDEMLVRFDPSLTSTVDLALGEGLVSVAANGAVKLTALGVVLADEVAVEDSVLVAEKQFLGALPAHITQAQINEILEWK